MPMFTSAIVLLVNIWGKTTSDQEQDLAILKNCIEMLTEMEKGFVDSSNAPQMIANSLLQVFPRQPHEVIHLHNYRYDIC